MALSLKAKKSHYCNLICRAWCCKNLVTQYGGNEFDILKFFELRNIEYDKETKTMVIPCKCRWLTNQNKCRLYAWRPESCRAYECDKLKSITIDS